MYGDQKKLDVVKREKNISLFLNYHAFKVETQNGRARAVVARNIIDGRELRFAGTYFADCTGDATIGFLAGADYEMLRVGHMGPSNLWRVEDAQKPSPFPRCPWALNLSGMPFPTELKSLGKWFWESGFSKDPIVEAEYVRDHNFRAMYGAWDCLKNEKNMYPNHVLEWAAYVAGKRESRRLLGDLVLSQDDLVRGKTYPDGCVPSTWAIDLHLPDPRYGADFPDEEFISHVVKAPRFSPPYPIPYRCLYSRNVPNLFMAGRNISVTHEALGSVRVMRTCGMMGEVVGKAVSLCRKHKKDPRAIYQQHLDEFKALLAGPAETPGPGTRPPGPAGENLARSAAVTTSGDKDAAKWPPSLVNDGKDDTSRNDMRWLSKPQVPNWVEFTWKEPRTVAAVRIVSGFNSGNDTVADPISDFVLQVPQGDQWKDVPGTPTAGNDEVDWSREFNAVTTTKVRLLVRKTNLNTSRIWEVELYGPAKSP